MTSTIKRWGAHGYGFIEDPAGIKDIFCHVSQVQNIEVDPVSGNTFPPRPGRPVEFEIMQGPQGPMAGGVTLL